MIYKFFFYWILAKRTPWYYCQQISNIDMRIETIINCCKTWPGSICCSELSSILFDYPFLPLKTQNDVKNLVKKIKVYNEILEVKSDLEAVKTWFDVSEISFASPKLILNTLIKNNQVSIIKNYLPSVILLSFTNHFILFSVGTLRAMGQFARNYRIHTGKNRFRIYINFFSIFFSRN